MGEVRPKPQVVENVFEVEDFHRLRHKMMQLDKGILNQSDFGRFATNHEEQPILWEYSEKILPLAREIFKSKTLLPSYTLFSHYEGPGAKLWKHRDDNACTYTLDVHLYYKTNWDLWVDGVSYTIPQNGAAAFYGEEQEHWREEFPDPENNYVGAVFFHFVEPDHWWFTKGHSYIEVVRGNISEEEWSAENIS